MKWGVKIMFDGGKLFLLPKFEVSLPPSEFRPLSDSRIVHTEISKPNFRQVDISPDFFATNWKHFYFFSQPYYVQETKSWTTLIFFQIDFIYSRMKRQQCFQSITALSLCWWPLVTSYQVVKMAINFPQGSCEPNQVSATFKTSFNTKWMDFFLRSPKVVQPDTSK